MLLIGARRAILRSPRRSLFNDFTVGVMPPWLSFNRATSTTDSVYTDAAGSTYNTFAANAPRLGSYGLGIFEQRTQSLLNSTAPATQTVTLATGTYTLWAIGTGTVAVSAGTGAGSGLGTHTPGTPLVFSVSTAGTFIFTVSGALSRFQCEAGSFATPFIVSVGAAVTRSADVVQFTGAGLAFLQGAAASAVVETGGILSKTTPAIIAGNAANFQYLSIDISSSLSYIYNNSFRTNGPIFPVSSLNPGPYRLGVATSPTGSIITSGGLSSTFNSASFNGSAESAYTLGNDPAFPNFLDGYVRKLALYSYQLSSATLQAKTVAGAALP